jgi:hypothetical protein
MTHAVDRANDRIASFDHFNKPMHAVLDSAVVMLKVGSISCREGLEVADDRIAPTNVENAGPTEIGWRTAISRNVV